MEGCDHEAKTTKGGLRLCKLHSAKEGKPRPHEAEGPAKALLEAAKPAPAEARFAPGEGGVGPRDEEASARLGRFLSEILAGGADEEALRAVSKSDEGPREAWESLREQAGVYLPKLPKDYPPAARKALLRLLTEEAPVPQDRAPQDDPVLGLKEVPTRGEDRQVPPARPQTLGTGPQPRPPQCIPPTERSGDEPADRRTLCPCHWGSFRAGARGPLPGPCRRLATQARGCHFIEFHGFRMRSAAVFRPAWAPDLSPLGAAWRAGATRASSAASFQRRHVNALHELSEADQEARSLSRLDLKPKSKPFAASSSGSSGESPARSASFR